MEIIYSAGFVKGYRRLPAKIKFLAEKKEIIFRKDPYDPRLKTHSLSGKFLGRWAFSVNHQYRILFKFIDNGTIWFLDIGTHEVYK